LQSSGVKRDKALGNALRRFSYAGERTRRADDRLVDLMIVAEALFLSESGDPESRGELQYRLALRAAFFLTKIAGSQRRYIFELVKRAYKARSSLVHGDTVDTVKLPNGKEIRLEEFADAMEDLMRSAVKKRVAIATEGRKMDWESLILGQ
jgi:hypothetical protein